MKQCRWCAEQIQDAAALCRYCGREADPAPGEHDPPAPLSRVLRAAEVLLGIGAVLLVAYLLAARLELVPELGGGGAAGAPDGLRSRPAHVVPLFALREVDVAAGEHFDTLFTVEDPRPCLLRGSIAGVAGGRHDVEVLVLDEAGYADWHNGVAHAPLYHSGRTSLSELNVPLPRPGEYALVVSNAFSVITGKRVRLEGVEVRCE